MTRPSFAIVCKNKNTWPYRTTRTMFLRLPQFPAWRLCLVLISVLMLSPIVDAQVLERHDTVAERARPGLDADGMPVGAMRLYPSVGVRLRYTDNVFADDNMKASDTAFHVLPELRLQSRSPRHRAELGGNADIARYADLRTEDFDDFRFWALGDMQVRNGKLEARLRLSDIHEDR
ncbi:MAG TPA: hypothetical protein ENK16_03090, partial [Chromatiales bacterium]|nr:hypothetical protein [Chromatiales bacterium]